MILKGTDSGSQWRRWDPHVHAPGTVLNDQFTGPNAWDDYLKALEESVPAIEVIGVTDYYSTETYEHVCRLKAEEGRLSGCALLFPNIEMRLALGTPKGRWVNLHLLVSPEDPRHVEEAQRIISRLTMDALDDSFSCTKSDLIRLGYKHGSPAGDDKAALKLGSVQFKVDFTQLRQVFRDFGWARDNILVAVAGGSDGTSGLQDAADAAIRREVEKFADIVFASSPAQRQFWLGQGVMQLDELRRLYRGEKPCLHGSDAHAVADVGTPTANRFSWIKGDPTFDALKQACITPSSRAFVGETPPLSALASQVITKFELTNAPWAVTPAVNLNPGLVAIIGARGSGKTALAELIAAACDAVPLPLEKHKQSFLYRARDFLVDTQVAVTWRGGEAERRAVFHAVSTEYDQYPRVRYLSQQFVDELCASDGVTDALLKEVERVVYESHSVSDRDGATDFDDLLDIRATRFRAARLREEQSLENLSERIGSELEKQRSVPSLEKQVKEKEQLIARHLEDRSKLVAKGSEQTIARLEAITQAAEKVRYNVRFFNLQEQQLLTLQDEVADVRISGAPESLRKLKSRHETSGIKGDDWVPFTLDYKGPVDTILTDRIGKARKNSADWKGTAPAQVAAATPLIADDADLTQQTLALLEAELDRLGQQVSLEKNIADKYAALSQKIVTETDLLGTLKEKLEDAKGARERVRALVSEREASYTRVFDAIVSEQSILNELYAPIKARLAEASGSLNKLSFSVTRTADIDRWAEDGERLLDLRQLGPFKGRGTLKALANEQLKPAWESGDAAAVAAAMQAFRNQHDDELLERANVPKSNQLDYRTWLKRFAKWLYSTEHVTVRYSVDYDSTDIRNLSPGTRGIVLLLLYLALDDADDRPLIIDQPEENLDPKSIFDELVGLFSTAKLKRQVIMVTHNANLVINTDADQIIVATVGTHAPGSLPPITYMAGGLENADTRKAVCDILEGGEDAFKERAKRLRVAI